MKQDPQPSPPPPPLLTEYPPVNQVGGDEAGVNGVQPTGGEPQRESTEEEHEPKHEFQTYGSQDGIMENGSSHLVVEYDGASIQNLNIAV